MGEPCGSDQDGIISHEVERAGPRQRHAMCEKIVAREIIATSLQQQPTSNNLKAKPTLFRSSATG